MQMGLTNARAHHRHHHHNKTLENLIHHTHHQLKFLANSTEKYDIESKELQKLHDLYDELPLWKKIKLHFQIKTHNKGLQYFERNFLHSKGLHKRPWFKHIVFASGRYTGYAGQNLPGLNEAIE